MGIRDEAGWRWGGWEGRQDLGGNEKNIPGLGGGRALPAASTSGRQFGFIVSVIKSEAVAISHTVLQRFLSLHALLHSGEARPVVTWVHIQQREERADLHPRPALLFVSCFLQTGR